GDLAGEHLIQGDLLGDRDGGGGDDLPVVVRPGGGVAQGAAHHAGHGLGVEADHFGALAQAADHGLADGGVRGVGGQPDQRPVQVLQRLVGFQEEVPVDVGGGDNPVGAVQVGDDQLAAHDLVLAVVLVLERF